MRSFDQACHEFLSALNLTERQQEEASAQHVRLRDALSRAVALDPDHQTFLSGSYARKTAIRPLDDIDMLCVLKPTAEQRHTWSPREALAYIDRALRATNPGKTPRIQNRSVNIAFTGTGIAYDVVPAFAVGDYFLVPDVRRGEWIRSNPRVHAEKATAANARAGGELKRLTKAVKHWNRRLPEEERARSFLLEVMAWDVLTARPANAATGLRVLFDGLATRLGAGRVPEPARLGPDLDEALPDLIRIRTIERLRTAGAMVREAEALAHAGSTPTAHRVLFELFGEPYPERGAAR